MKNIRERIRINGESISEELFTKCFYEIWDRLPSHATAELDIPRYLQLLALMSYHVFITENVDVAIYETHLGGEYDATNIVPRPIIAAVTTIAPDHVRLLGPEIEYIAWHKAGIFKPGALAFSARQVPKVAAVLQERATENKTAPLNFIDVDDTLPTTNVACLIPRVQRQNCSLALTIARAWLEVIPEARHVLTPNDIATGIENFRWPGRFQTIVDGKFEWYLDGAHDELSVQHAVEWYAQTTTGDSHRSVIIIPSLPLSLTW